MLSRRTRRLTQALCVVMVLAFFSFGSHRPASARQVAPIVQGILINTIATSAWSKPSPDPSGITYWPARDRLVIVDGEVDEMAIYAGANIFVSTRQGALTGTATTKPWSREPVGIEIAVNPESGHFFISDDVQKRIYEVTIGLNAQGQVTSIALVRSFSTTSYGNNDPEGLTLDDTGILYLTNGIDKKVHRIDPGPNGIFDGVAPDGDDQMTQWLTKPLGQTDPEGIDYHDGLLYLISNHENTPISEVTTAGVLVRTISLAGIDPVAAADLTWAPATTRASEEHIYVVARGVDNNDDPNENDGKLYEIAISDLPGRSNLLLNPGFELDTNADGPDRWSANSHFTRSSTLVHGGVYAGRHRASDNSGYTVRQQVSDLTGTNYTFSGWVNIPPTSDSFNFKLQVRWFDAAGISLRIDTIQTYTGPTAGWQQATQSLIAPAGASKIQVRMIVSSLNATIHVDDFSFEAAP